MSASGATTNTVEGIVSGVVWRRETNSSNDISRSGAKNEEVNSSTWFVHCSKFCVRAESSKALWSSERKLSSVAVRATECGVVHSGAVYCKLSRSKGATSASLNVASRLFILRDVSNTDEKSEKRHGRATGGVTSKSACVLVSECKVTALMVDAI
jgi:hypothetical protein